MPHLEAFLSAAILLTLLPGPDNLYVITRGISQGRKAALAAAAGFASGCLWHTLLATLGIAALITQSPMAFNLVRYAGAAYLVYLGIRTLLDRSGFALQQDGQQPDLWQVYRQSVLANMLNPKVTLFFLSFLPQFVNHAEGHVPQQMLVMGVLFMLQTMVIFGLFGWFAGHIGQWLQRSPAIARRIHLLAGSIFCALGLRVALVK